MLATIMYHGGGRTWEKMMDYPGGKGDGHVFGEYDLKFLFLNTNF